MTASSISGSWMRSTERSRSADRPRGWAGAPLCLAAPAVRLPPARLTLAPPRDLRAPAVLRVRGAAFLARVLVFPPAARRAPAALRPALRAAPRAGFLALFARFDPALFLVFRLILASKFYRCRGAPRALFSCERQVPPPLVGASDTLLQSLSHEFISCTFCSTSSACPATFTASKMYRTTPCLSMMNVVLLAFPAGSGSTPSVVQIAPLGSARRRSLRSLAATKPRCDSTVSRDTPTTTVSSFAKSADR